MSDRHRRADVLAAFARSPRIMGAAELARMLNPPLADSPCEWCPVNPPKPGEKCATVPVRSRRRAERKGTVMSMWLLAAADELRGESPPRPGPQEPGKLSPGRDR